MGVFSFRELDDLKRLQIYEFIKEANEFFNKSFEGMKKFYLSEVFNYGESLFVSFDENKIVGTIGIITKEIPIKGEAFITEIFLNQDFLDCSLKVYGQHIVNELIQKAVDICEKHKAEKITLGLKNKLDFLAGYVFQNGFVKTHEAIIMKYEAKDDAKKKNMDIQNKNSFKLVPLSEKTLEEFTIIHNEGFRGTPNGSNLSVDETRELFNGYIGNEELIGIVKAGDNSIGIYMVTVDEKVGWIDNIAILEEFRDQGYGKVLINECINLLKNKQINSIKLLVMSSNTVAYKFYKNYGFIEEQVYSTWYEKDK